MASSKNKNLPVELRATVKWAVAILGELIREELGDESYRRIEKIRKSMASLRGKDRSTVLRVLKQTQKKLEDLDSVQRFEFAKSYTLMLELMNACENAYRTHRLMVKKQDPTASGAEAIYFVLTAHPTEARSPQNIGIFNEIQKTLVRCFSRGFHEEQDVLKALLNLAWKIEIVRMRKPRVRDEAEHIYSILLRDANLSTLLDFGASHVPVLIRSWVGGDKDGHPGVDESVMTQSLQMSRDLLIVYLGSQVEKLKDLALQLRADDLKGALIHFGKTISGIRKLKHGDASRVMLMRNGAKRMFDAYQKNIGNHFPKEMVRIKQLLKIFPGLVVPLELREDSSVLMSDPSGKSLAIGRMLKRISDFSGVFDPTIYARGLIISMAQNPEQIVVGIEMVQKCLGNHKIPVVPLFEQKDALDSGSEIVDQLLKNPKIKNIVKSEWGGIFEIMVGYSDSAKESGVLPSRLSILDAIQSLDSVCKKRGVEAVFFHGSGGSVDRGGGAIRDQIAGWPRNALHVYKATVQGEMVERTFSSPEILRSQLYQISEMTDPHRVKVRPSPKSVALSEFSSRVRKEYQAMIHDQDFLEMVQLATPYSFLNALKIGSRPSKRASAGLKVSGLRAIPWVLCWTQTRILFPTWWGVGTAWDQTSLKKRGELKKLFHHHAVFKSYVHALGFTLAKVELAIFEYYLKNSGMNASQIEKFTELFKSEFKKTRKCFEEITGQKNPLWFRPWLGESIDLRATMIHPLNLLELMARKDKDLKLLRVSVAGIASGMLTTG